MQKLINITIERKDKEVFLLFHFDSILKLNLSTDGQEEAKSFFQKLLKIIFDSYNDFNDEFDIKLLDDGDDLFHDVACKYVEVLKNEIQSLYSNLKTKKE